MRLTRTATALMARTRRVGGDPPGATPHLRVAGAAGTGRRSRWVLATGGAEVWAAALMAAPATRRAGGWAAAGLLVGFLPAHLHTFRVVPRTALPLTVAALRLPLQAPLIGIALRVARGR